MAILRVPGASRVRRLRDLLRAVRAARVTSSPLALLGFAKDVILLLRDLAVDPRVPRLDRVIALGAIAYLFSPVDLVFDLVPVLGQFDDFAVAGFALHRLLDGAGRDVVADRWRGTDAGLALLLRLGGVDDVGAGR